MSLFDKVRSEIPSGTILKTPVQKVEFRIEYEEDKVVLFKDTKKKPFSKTPKVCWDSMLDFLEKENWVKIGGKFGTPEKGTLQDYIDSFHPQGKGNSNEANHIASILERLEIVEIDRNLPSKVRLITPR
jgi:hypothetical protein